MKTFLHKKTYILAVDDDTDLLSLFRLSMKARGYHVEISVNAVNFWDYMSAGHPDVILLDIRMDGIDGGDICKQLKSDEKTSDIPVIMLSANDDVEHIAENCGADSFLNKPFNADKVAYEIEKLLGHAA